MSFPTSRVHKRAFVAAAVSAALAGSVLLAPVSVSASTKHSAEGVAPLSTQTQAETRGTVNDRHDYSCIVWEGDKLRSYNVALSYKRTAAGKKRTAQIRSMSITQNTPGSVTRAPTLYVEATHYWVENLPDISYDVRRDVGKVNGHVETKKKPTLPPSIQKKLSYRVNKEVVSYGWNLRAWLPKKGSQPVRELACTLVILPA